MLLYGNLSSRGLGAQSTSRFYYPFRISFINYSRFRIPTWLRLLRMIDTNMGASFVFIFPQILDHWLLFSLALAVIWVSPILSQTAVIVLIISYR